MYNPGLKQWHITCSVCWIPELLNYWQVPSDPCTTKVRGTNQVLLAHNCQKRDKDQCLWGILFWIAGCLEQQQQWLFKCQVHCRWELRASWQQTWDKTKQTKWCRPIVSGRIGIILLRRKRMSFVISFCGRNLFEPWVVWANWAKSTFWLEPAVARRVGVAPKLHQLFAHSNHRTEQETYTWCCR